MDQQSDQEWLFILRLSYDMLDLAKKGEFDDLVELEASRQSKIKAVFQQHENYAAHDYVKQGISKILKIDAEIQATCRHEQTDLLKQLKSLGVSKKATLAYVENSK